MGANAEAHLLRQHLDHAFEEAAIFKQQLTNSELLAERAFEHRLAAQETGLKKQFSSALAEDQATRSAEVRTLTKQLQQRAVAERSEAALAQTLRSELAEVQSCLFTLHEDEENRNSSEPFTRMTAKKFLLMEGSAVAMAQQFLREQASELTAEPSLEEAMQEAVSTAVRQALSATFTDQRDAMSPLGKARANVPHNWCRRVETQKQDILRALASRGGTSSACGSLSIQESPRQYSGGVERTPQSSPRE